MGEERYGVALFLPMAACILIRAAPDGAWGKVVIVTLEGGALVASSRAAQVSMHVRVLCGILAGASIFFATTEAAFGDSSSAVYVSATSVVLVLLATPIIGLGTLRQAKTGQRVTVHTMLGVLCIYLLMTLAFASAFGMVGSEASGPFFTQGEEYSQLRDYLYFSITTITTLGIGDFTPASDLGRSLTAFESLIGQIYLVTVVAVIVGNLRPKK